MARGKFHKDQVDIGIEEGGRRIDSAASLKDYWLQKKEQKRGPIRKDQGGPEEREVEGEREERHSGV